MDLRALGEGADPAVQERARGVGQRILPVRGVEPQRVGTDRHHARDHQGEESAPANHHQQRLANGPHQRRVPDEKPGDSHGQGRGAVTPAQGHHGDGGEEDEQRIGRDHVLDVQLIGVEQHGQRGQSRTPPGQASMPEQRVDGDAQANPHRGLEQRDRIVTVQRQQQVEEEGVAVRPDLVRDVGGCVENVVVGVVEPQDRRVAEDHHDAHHDRGQYYQPELPVSYRRADDPF